MQTNIAQYKALFIYKSFHFMNMRVTPYPQYQHHLVSDLHQNTSITQNKAQHTRKDIHSQRRAKRTHLFYSVVIQTSINIFTRNKQKQEAKETKGKEDKRVEDRRVEDRRVEGV